MLALRELEEPQFIQETAGLLLDCFGTGTIPASAYEPMAIEALKILGGEWPPTMYTDPLMRKEYQVGSEPESTG